MLLTGTTHIWCRCVEIHTLVKIVRKISTPVTSITFKRLFYKPGLLSKQRSLANGNISNTFRSKHWKVGCHWLHKEIGITVIIIINSRVTTAIITLNFPCKGYVSTLTKIFISMVFRTRHINHTISMNYFELIHGLPYAAHAHTAAHMQLVLTVFKHGALWMDFSRLFSHPISICDTNLWYTNWQV